MAILTTAVLTLATALGAPSMSGHTRAIRTSIPPVIDGRLEDVWQQGLLFEHFAQFEPDVAHETNVKTEVFFLYDADNVYLAARVHQPRSTIRAAQGRGAQSAGRR